MKILITGSRGFMGASIGHAAARAGHKVLGVSLSSQPEADWPGEHYRADASCADISSLIRKFSPQVLFHGVGTASVGASFATPAEDFRIALLTWSHTLDSVRRSGVRPLIIFPSSAAVYGNPSSLPVAEAAPLSPISPYGFHKVACELLAQEYARCFGLDILVCRFFSVFGARQRRLLVWELYQQFMGRARAVSLQGQGTETRDYLCMDDIAEVLLRLMRLTVAQRNGGSCLVINVGRGTQTRICDLATLIGQLLGKTKPVHCRGLQRPGDPLHWQADIRTLKTLLPDWNPTPLSESLARCLEVWRDADASSHSP